MTVSPRHRLLPRLRPRAAETARVGRPTRFDLPEERKLPLQRWLACEANRSYCAPDVPLHQKLTSFRSKSRPYEVVGGPVECSRADSGSWNPLDECQRGRAGSSAFRARYVPRPRTGRRARRARRRVSAGRFGKARSWRRPATFQDGDSVLHHRNEPSTEVIERRHTFRGRRGDIRPFGTLERAPLPCAICWLSVTTSGPSPGTVPAPTTRTRPACPSRTA
jgi:hypothetical protein